VRDLVLCTICDVNEFELRRAEHLQRVRQLAESLPADAVISHESGAVAHGFPVYTLPAALKVTRTRGRGVRTSDVHVHIAQLRPQDVTILDGVPVTSGARTAVDVARRVSFREGLVITDGAMRQQVSRNELSPVLRHQWTWPGVRHAAIAVRHTDAKAESALESVVRGRFVELHLPLPELQVNVYDGVGFIGRVDFDLSSYNTVGEADGRVKYLEDELWREKLRQERLEDTGREVIRWTWRSAHVPDEEFAGRVWRKLRRGLYLRGFAAS